MDLSNFPYLPSCGEEGGESEGRPLLCRMDHQVCYLTLESFNYNAEEVKMRWLTKTAPVLLLKEPIELPDFTLINWTVVREAVPYPAGVWDELTIKLLFERRYGWYVLQAYVPTYLTIFIRYASPLPIATPVAWLPAAVGSASAWVAR